MNFALILALVSLAPTANSFSACSLTRHRTSLLPVNLVPSQGNQLVAASALVYQDDDAIAKPTEEKESKARSFVSRVFSLPASFLHPHGMENEVLYPVVGFQYVEDPESHQCRVLPTVSNASCRLPSLNERVFGWYSSACKLSCTDDDEYCDAPKKN